MQLNVAKTKDMLIDLRCNPSAPQITTIKGQLIGVVETYEYLGSLI